MEVQKSLPQFFDRVLEPRDKGLRSIMPHPVNMGPYKEPLLQAVQPMEEKVSDERLRSNKAFFRISW